MSWRQLICTRCDEVVEVWEYVLTPLDAQEAELPFIDPERFVCERCMMPVLEHEQTSLLDERQERRRYDPMLSEIPY